MTEKNYSHDPQIPRLSIVWTDDDIEEIVQCGVTRKVAELFLARVRRRMLDEAEAELTAMDLEPINPRVTAPPKPKPEPEESDDIPDGA
jgi:hypothetical protein